MSEQIDLRELERKAYLSYHEDGIIDLMIGFNLINAALWVLAEMPWLTGSMIAIMTPLYLQLKKSITVPRLGHVEFSESRKGKTKRTMFYMVVFNLILFVGGLYAWLSIYGGGRPQWLSDLLENYMLLFGVLGMILSSLVAYMTDLKRFYSYGLINLVTFTVMSYLRIHLSYSLVVLGVIMTLYGFYLLLNFRRKYSPIEVDTDV